MKTRLLQLSALLFTALLSITSVYAACGIERWSIKVATDSGAPKIIDHPTPITINQLSLIQAPINPAIRATTRYAPTELTVYEMTGTISLVKQEADSDYHIVMHDGKGNTMIVESAAPHCAAGSRFAKEITAVRKALDAQLGGPNALPQNNLNLMATVTGVGFFDRIHGQTGVAANGIELHPITGIIFHTAKTMEDLQAEVSGTLEAD